MPSQLFLELPRELLGNILTNLKHTDIARCCRVCRTLRETIYNSVTLLYQIELEIEGYSDGPKGDLCTAERLKLLIDRRNRWLHLDWTQVLTLKSSKTIPESPLPYELQGGTFFTVTSARGKFTINETSLPSRTEASVLYSQSDFEIQCVDITTDSSQDLMVLLDVQGRLHVWSLSTHIAHRSAQKPILRQEGTPEVRMTGLSIAHDLVALVEWTNNVGLTIWNWKTGCVILHGYGSTLPYLVTGFAWLSATAFVLADADGNDLVVFSLSAVDCDAPEAPRNFIDFPACARLKLPRIHENWHISFFQLETTPLLASVPLERPFMAAPETHIVVFTLQYATADHTNSTGRYLGFVHNRALMEHVPPLDSSHNTPETKDVPWEEWGPKNTRIIPNRLSRAFYARYVHGQRVVFPSLRIGSLRSQVAVLFDFNVHPKRLSAARGGNEHVEDTFPIGFGEKGRFRLVSHPDVIRSETVEMGLPGETLVHTQPFVEDVETYLPYVTTNAPVEASSGGIQHFMIDEERLVQIIPRVDILSSGGRTLENGIVRVYTF